jgi:hypothetical protein
MSETVSLQEHLISLREADLRFDAERDRRYAEVALEREKALKIKEQADRDALELDRQIRAYKDEKANDLREQLGKERGNYATKDDVIAAVGKIDATLIPIATYVASQQGGSKGMRDMYGWIFGGVMGIVAVIGLYLKLT